MVNDCWTHMLALSTPSSMVYWLWNSQDERPRYKMSSIDSSFCLRVWNICNWADVKDDRECQFKIVGYQIQIQNQIHLFSSEMSSQWGTIPINICTLKHVQFQNSDMAIQAGGGTAHKPFSLEGLTQGVSSCRIGWLVLGRPRLSKVLRTQTLIRKIYVQNQIH